MVTYDLGICGAQFPKKTLTQIVEDYIHVRDIFEEYSIDSYLFWRAKGCQIFEHLYLR